MCGEVACTGLHQGVLGQVAAGLQIDVAGTGGHVLQAGVAAGAVVDVAGAGHGGVGQGGQVAIGVRGEVAFAGHDVLVLGQVAASLQIDVAAGGADLLQADVTARAEVDVACVECAGQGQGGQVATGRRGDIAGTGEQLADLQQVALLRAHIDVAREGTHVLQRGIAACSDGHVAALVGNGIRVSGHGDIAIGADREVTVLGADVGVLLEVAARAHGDVTGRGADQLVLHQVAASGDNDVAGAGSDVAVLLDVPARGDGDIAGVGRDTCVMQDVAASIEHDVAGVGGDPGDLLDIAASRDGDIADFGTDPRILLDVAAGAQADRAAVVGCHGFVDGQVAGGADFDVAVGSVQTVLGVEAQVRGDAADDQVAIQVVDLDAAGVGVGHQVADLDVQRLVRADAVDGFHRQVGGVDVAAAVGLGVGDQVARDQGHRVAGGAGGQGADVQRAAGGDGDVAVVGFQGTDGQVVDFGQVDLAGGGDVDGVDLGVQGAVGIAAGGANGACCLDVQGVGDDQGVVVLVIVHRAIGLQVDLASAGVEAADDHCTTGLEVDVAAGGLQVARGHGVGFTHGDVAGVGDFGVEGVDFGVQVDVAGGFGHQGAALYVALDGVAIDDRAVGAGQAHGMGVSAVFHQLVDFQRTVGGDADVAGTGDAFDGALGTDGQQCAAVGVDDGHATVTGVGCDAVGLGVDRLQGTDAVAGDHFQVRGDQYAALAEDGLARLEADGGVAGDGTDHADVTGGFGDDLLAGSDGDVAQAQAASGVQVQAGVDDAAVVDVQAVGRDAQRLVGRAVDHLVLVVGSHGLLAHLQGGIAGCVGLEHGQIGGGLGGGGGVTDRRGGRQVGGGGVDRSVGHVQGVVQLDQQILLRCQAVALVAVQRQGGGGHHQIDHGEGGVGTGVTGERYGLCGTGDDRCGVTHHGGGVQRSVQGVGGGRHAVDLGGLGVGADLGQTLGQLGQAVLHGGRGHQGLVVL